MSKSNAFENALLKLIFNASAVTGLADNPAVGALTNLYVSLHSADPGEAGDQTTSEVAYTGYARVAVARTSGGWTVTGATVSPAANIDFPACAAGSVSATHFGIGTASSGAGVLLYSGQLVDDVGDPAPVAISAGVSPRLLTTTTITED
ncbi:hypothetical protein [Phenylobacterium sp.]|uniref:phage tail fiber protein n=1 Tax=Phenylobacterium sp. TaxID=1871053 RepID=UPI003920BE44